MTRKILECDMESCYKNISKIRNISFIFQNYEKKFSTKKIVNIYLDCEKSMNLFEKRRRCLIIYWKNIIFGNL